MAPPLQYGYSGLRLKRRCYELGAVGSLRRRAAPLATGPQAGRAGRRGCGQVRAAAPAPDTLSPGAVHIGPQPGLPDAAVIPGRGPGGTLASEPANGLRPRLCRAPSGAPGPCAAPGSPQGAPSPRPGVAPPG